MSNINNTHFISKERVLQVWVVRRTSLVQSMMNSCPTGGADLENAGEVCGAGHATRHVTGQS